MHLSVTLIFPKQHLKEAQVAGEVRGKEPVITGEGLPRAGRRGNELYQRGKLCPIMGAATLLQSHRFMIALTAHVSALGPRCSSGPHK